MSANLVVDIGNTCQFVPSITTLSLTSGVIAAPCSGAIVGDVVDLGPSDTSLNIFVTGRNAVTSGQLRIAVQTSDSTVSGTFTDPTSGLATFPGAMQSGGILVLNSGGLGNGLFGAFVSGQCINSGFAVANTVQRNAQFARLIALSGDFFTGSLTAGFISNLRTTGSGGGFTFSPTSGTVNV